jgi:hypothetical protein
MYRPLIHNRPTQFKRLPIPEDFEEKGGGGNPNHDKDGRFSNGNSGSASWKKTEDQTHVHHDISGIRNGDRYHAHIQIHRKTQTVSGELNVNGATHKLTPNHDGLANAKTMIAAKLKEKTT